MSVNRCVAFWGCLAIAMGQWNHEHYLSGWLFFALAVYALFGSKKK